MWHVVRVVAVANQKGGVAKTATAVNLAAALGARGKKVLLVDLDPQASATGTFLRVRPQPGMYEVMTGQARVQDACHPSGREGVSVAGGHENMAALEVGLGGKQGREFVLAEVLREAEGYDFAIVDCPPTLGLLTINGLVAASEVIVPVQCEYLALEGLSRLVDTLERVDGLVGRARVPRRFLMTMYDRRNNLAREVVREVRSHFGGEVLRAVVPRTVRLAEAPGFRRTIFEHDPQGAGALAYMLVAEELLDGFVG